MKRVVFPLAAALCFLVLVSHASSVSAKDTWINVRTKNFNLIGNANEKEVRKVALKLEQFREVFTRLLPRMKYNTPVPTTVVVFKSRSSYAPFGPPSATGYFQSGPDVNYIALTTEAYGEENIFRIIFHEYTHLLINNTFKNAPLWFNEGMAEYYSTFKITDDQKFALGKPVGNNVLLLRQVPMLPLRTLFEVTHYSPEYKDKPTKSIFYAQSWALMHYLILGKEGQQDKLAKFMELVAADVPVEVAFPQAFETTFEAMEKELRDYVTQNRYNYVTGQLAQKVQVDTTAEAKLLTEAEAQAYLGDLLLHTNHPDAAKYLENALRLDPNLAMAHASLGMLRFREHRTDEARASLERAITLSSNNYLIHYYYAYSLSRRSPEEKSERYTPEQITKIRQHLKRAIELRPDYPETYDLMAYVSLVTLDQVDEAIAAMKRVLHASPGRIYSKLVLAQLYMHTEDYKSARPLLEQVAKSSDSMSEYARKTLANLDEYEQRMAEYNDLRVRPPGGTSSTDPNVVVAGETPVVVQRPDPSADLRAALRKRADGETQIQATLVKIECEVKNIVFVLQTPAGLLRLRTNRFEDVEIVTYTTDVKGDISCGPRKPLNAVVICYIPGPNKRARADGVLKSIEFVPSDFKLNK
jgi:tetratricopeptide (TPR) repeat protein